MKIFLRLSLLGAFIFPCWNIFRLFNQSHVPNGNLFVIDKNITVLSGWDKVTENTYRTHILTEQKVAVLVAVLWNEKERRVHHLILDPDEGTVRFDQGGEL